MESMYIGSLTNCSLKIDGIKFSNTIKYLGVYISTLRNEYLKTNWDDKIGKFQNLLDNWKSKKLTIYSKVDVIKFFTLSKLFFTAQMLTTPDDIVPKVEKIIYNFIWEKKDKIR